MLRAVGQKAFRLRSLLLDKHPDYNIAALSPLPKRFSATLEAQSI
jgi:hypothetical protein